MSIVACWSLFPDLRFGVIPALIVAIYLVRIWAMERRWRALPAAAGRQDVHFGFQQTK